MPCDTLVIAHALCVELGWPGTAVGPAGLMWGTHTCAVSAGTKLALLRGLSAHQMGRVDISICCSPGPISYTILNTLLEKGDTELEKDLSVKYLLSLHEAPGSILGTIKIKE